MRPPIPITKRAGKKLAPTPTFASLYRKLIGALLDVFPVEDNPQSYYPPDDCTEFIQKRYARAPKRHQQLSQELWTLLREIENNGRRVNRKVLHQHQFAHLIWVATALCDGPRSPKSFFIQGAPGTGKTLTLGVLMEACIRLQQRSLMKGKIAFCTAKPYHMSSKVRGKGMGHRRVLRSPPYVPSDKDIQRRYTGLCRLDAEFMKRCFRKKDWKELFRQEIESETEARRIVASFLEERGVDVDDSEAEMLRHVEKVLASIATTVRGVNGSTELLQLPPVPSDDRRLVSHTGDAAFAIPAEYPIFSRENIGVSTAERCEAKIVLEPATIFTSSRQIEKFRDELHRHIEVILCDEAQRRQPTAFQEPVASSGAKDIPIVFAAGSQWYGKNWERRSPVHSFPESIRRGILPDVGVRVFPSASEPHYPAETEEGFEQLMEAYFQTLESFSVAKIPQPYASNTLVVVHARLVDDAVRRLREDYSKIEPAAQIRPFYGNEEDREALQIWFDSERDGPNILVSSASIVKESLDLLSLRHLIVGTRVTADALYHLTGRLAHGRNTLSSTDRMLISVQQFADSNLAATPFVGLDHGQELPEQGFRWINGSALMSEKAYRRDQRRHKNGSWGDDEVEIPPHGRRKRGAPLPIKVLPGHSTLPNKKGQLIDPMQRNGSNPLISRLALVPVIDETYDPKVGPPSRDLARSWAAQCDGLVLFDMYPSIMLVVEEAHLHGTDPQAALEQKIARLRERSSGMT